MDRRHAAPAASRPRRRGREVGEGGGGTRTGRERRGGRGSRGPRSRSRGRPRPGYWAYPSYPDPPLPRDRPPSPAPPRAQAEDAASPGGAAEEASWIRGDDDVEGFVGEGSSIWEELLATDARISSRASSATDAGMLKRKGRLKEQDNLIEFIQGMNGTHTPVETMAKMDRWVEEHRRDPARSQLRRLCPFVGDFHTPLCLTEALEEYDAFFQLSRRKYVPPNFAEIRHVLNIAQVHGIADRVRLVTFDADGTIYQDGHHIEQDNTMIDEIVSLMMSGVDVAIVTAAGYPGEPKRFEQRVQGLLDTFKKMRLGRDVTRRFHIMGGECNYLLNVTPAYGLEFVPDAEWKSGPMLEWSDRDIAALLDEGQRVLEATAEKLGVPVMVLRKERAVGVVPTGPTIYEVLEEMAITVQVELGGNPDLRVPFCAFNGGNDVFVDVGSKSFGLDALMRYVGSTSAGTLHVGDRFTMSGNDAATRDVCSILWVACPEETAWFIRVLLEDLRKTRRDAR